MSCQEITPLLLPYLEKELAVKENAEVKNHLSACSICQEELALLQNSWEALSLWEDVEPPADITQKVWQKLGKDKPKMSFWTKIYSLFYVPSPAYATLVVIFFAFLAVSFFGLSFKKDKVTYQPQAVSSTYKLPSLLSQNLTVIPAVPSLTATAYSHIPLKLANISSDDLDKLINEKDLIDFSEPAVDKTLDNSDNGVNYTTWELLPDADVTI